jgi:diacylglycerol kinase
MRVHHISFKHAWDGIVTGFLTQPNFRVHLFLSSLAIIAGLSFRLMALEWILLIFTICLGLVVELINTAIEFTVDLIIQEKHLLAKYAKDTAAAAMLIYALGAVIIAGLIFIPKLWLFISV